MDLQFKTGKKNADSALRAIAIAFGDAFPNHPHGCFVLGSYAKGTARDSSDLDVIVVFRHRLTDESKKQTGHLVDRLKATLNVEVDIGVCSIDDCPPVWSVCLRAGQLFSGLDMHPPLPEMEDYVTALINDVVSLIRGLRPEQNVGSLVDYPNADLPLYGYEAKPLRDSAGRWAPSTKALSMITCWGATALLALHTGTYTTSKDEVIDLYGELIADDWTELLTAVDHLCRRELSYAIPPSQEANRRLRALAGRVLRFENHLLATFRASDALRS